MKMRLMSLRGAALLAAAGLALPAGAVSLTVTDSNVSYGCTLGGMSVDINGNITADVSGCSPALGGGGGGGGTPVTIPAGAVTVAAMAATTNPTPTITGTAELAAGETLSVKVNSKSYAPGAHLTLNGTAWTLVIPSSDALPIGTYNVEARMTSGDGGFKVDSTSNELVIRSVPGAPGADPGTGLWSPDPTASPVVYVVDQSNPNGEGSVTILPGCVNGESTGNGAQCREYSTYSSTINGAPVSVQLTAGKIISIRYRVNKTAVAKSLSGTFRLSNQAGGGIGASTTMSLSTVPGDMSPGPARCTTTSSMTPALGTGTNYCSVDTGRDFYYLNIRVNQACSICSFQVTEDSQLLY